MRNFLAFILFVFAHYSSLGQNDYLELKLHVSCLRKQYHDVELSMYMREDKCFLQVSSKSELKENNIKDTLYAIDKKTYDEVCELALSISSVELLKEMNFTAIYTHSVGTSLTLRSLGGDGVVYRVSAPKSETKHRNLETYLLVCEKMLSLTNLPAKKILGKR